MTGTWSDLDTWTQTAVRGWVLNATRSMPVDTNAEENEQGKDGMDQDWHWDDCNDTEDEDMNVDEEEDSDDDQGVLDKSIDRFYEALTVRLATGELHKHGFRLHHTPIC